MYPPLGVLASNHCLGKRSIIRYSPFWVFKRKNCRSLGCGLLGKLVLGLLASLAIDFAVYGNRKHIPLRASVVGTVTWASLAELGTKEMGLSTPRKLCWTGFSWTDEPCYVVCISLLGLSWQGTLWNSVVVQWLGLNTFTALGQGVSLVGELGSCKLPRSSQKENKTLDWVV